MRAPESSAYEIVHPGGRPDVLLLCDHASNRIPDEFAGLGLTPSLLADHIAFDIGAADLTGALSDRLDAPAVLSRFSRLLIDPNRALDHPQSIPALSDGIRVPGNRKISAVEVARRVATYYEPYHAAIDARIAVAKQSCRPVLIAIHSFTPDMEGFTRPWHAAVLHDHDVRLANSVLNEFTRYAELVVGDNEPYTGYSDLTFTVPHHADRNDLLSVVFEVRQDLLETAIAIDNWAAVLDDVLAGPLAEIGVDKALQQP